VRQEFIALIGAAALMWSSFVHAQQPPPSSPKRIGVLTASCPSPSRDGLMFPRLADLGWIEGKNYVADCVSTGGPTDQLSTLARELVSRRPDVLVAIYSLYVRALMQETTSIPIVMATTPDPVRTGFVSNLARPEANVTGVAWFGFDILPKRIELLKEIVPDLKRLAIITTIRDTKLDLAAFPSARTASSGHSGFGLRRSYQARHPSLLTHSCPRLLRPIAVQLIGRA
jgi:putative tryptophan/tyrosine transport system substrate-binding protein